MTAEQAQAYGIIDAVIANRSGQRVRAPLPVRHPWQEFHAPRLARVHSQARTAGEEPYVAGKKRPKLVSHTKQKPPAKPKRPKKTSRGK